MEARLDARGGRPGFGSEVRGVKGDGRARETSGDHFLFWEERIVAKYFSEAMMA